MERMRIAVFCPNWVGDAVMATPALRALREHFVDASITAVLKPYVAGILEGSPWFDRQLLHEGGFTSPRGWRAIAASLRHLRSDVAVLFTNSFRSALIAWLGRCKRRIGYVRSSRGLLLTERLHFPTGPDGKRIPSPAIDSYHRLVEQLGCPRPSHRMELFTSAADENAADRVWERFDLGRFAEVICLNPGAAFGSAKQWPAEYFASLARELVDRRGSGVLMLCGPGEQGLARGIVRDAARPGVCSLADQPLSLGLTKACVRRCDLLITTDSGPRHFAAAFDRPVVSLFGPTHIAWTETYHPKAVHMQVKVDCGPCQLRVCPLDHRCMKRLGPSDVFSTSAELLRRFPPGSQRGRRAG
jgi:heptosyltransferase-2